MIKIKYIIQLVFTFLSKFFIFIVFLWGSFLFSSVVMANSTQLNLDFRNYPRGFSFGAQTKWSQFLWGKSQDSSEKNSISYGLIQESLQVGSHGFLGASVAIYPISFIKVEWQESIVSRYYETSTLPCDSLYCFGNLKRKNLSLGMALGYENYLFIPQYEESYQTPQMNSKNYGSEDEILVGRAGGDTMKTSSYFVGYRSEVNSVVGLFVKRSETKYFKNNALLRYFVYQQPLNIDTQMLDLQISKINLKTGIGFFSSTWVPTPQLSFFVGLSGGIGDDPSLF